MTPPSWDQRIERAEQLIGAYPFASECLRFYREICSLQKELYDDLVKRGDPRGQVGTVIPGPIPLETARVLPWFPRLLDLVQRVGPAMVAQAAGVLAEQDSTHWRLLLESYGSAPALADAESYQVEGFFARALLQPYAEFLAAQTDHSRHAYDNGVCPFCGRKPQMGVLRAEGYGARRSLVCSLCLTEWPCPRILCPACGEQRSDLLSVYTAAQFEQVRVEACDACRTYMKTIDLTKDGLAIPLVDELATTPLDLWAGQHGYRKLECNLLGL
ncbi:MAG: formate dehydrogenase accessory protein FdhE [Terriglobia bacterium]